MTANATTITTINPATEEALTTYDLMSKDAAFEKVVACHAAFLQWRTRSHAERATYLRNIAGALREHAGTLAALMTAETGKLLRDGNTEVELCAHIFEYTAEHGPAQLADESRTHSGGRKKGVVTYCPIGVVYSIQPWNFPVYQPARVLAANLMAGNGVILKHASICSGSGLMLRDVCLEAGLPKGLFDVVLMDHDISDEIKAHECVRGVTMTGSDTAGRQIGQQAAKRLKKSVLELGSNDSYLVLEDADVALAVKTCVMGRIYNNGETCVSAKRFVVTTTTLSVGYYFPATVLADCQPGTPAYDDELFGPVASIIKATDDADAMRIANDSRYGLGGGIFSQDENKAFRLARDHFDTGMVRINTFGTADPNMPFGGVKDSGYGREHGGFGVKEFVNAKAIYMPARVAGATGNTDTRSA